MKSGFPCISAANSKNFIGRPSAKLTVQLLPILAIAVALKLDHLNLGKRERSPRRQAWTEEWESVSGELLFRIPEDFRPATHSAKRNLVVLFIPQRPRPVAPRKSSVW